ncbi:MAG: nucleotidyl transferase AbiEii/AbiGii toxin family protein [Bacteroidetes bacterium]|nr:nucleotidyl transferase AbiEii/AbiGii toxin family protein [Bacteroidota bacterium]
MDFHKIKLITIAALLSDDILLGMFVLKGGNALELVYEITNRGSIDIDFSMEGDFKPEERSRVERQMDSLLKDEFDKHGYVVFDVKLNERPEHIREEVKSFWGGYLLEFKIIKREEYDKLSLEIDTVRRNAIPIKPDGSTKFTVDISKYEYVGRKEKRELDGSIVYVYSPAMLVLEKLRAICQQLPEYKEIIGSKKSSPRPRDFYDIYNLLKTFPDIESNDELKDMPRFVFEAKRVPLDFLNRISSQLEFHRQAWESVAQTVSQRETLNEFDYYFNFVVEFAYRLKS